MAIDKTRMLGADDLEIQGTGDSTMFRSDITGVLVGLIPRDGEYEWADREGVAHVSPQSYIAVFEEESTGKEVWGSWPAKYDEDGEKQPWSNFDAAYSIADLIREKKLVRFRKTGERMSFTKLTILERRDDEDDEDFMA